MNNNNMNIIERSLVKAYAWTYPIDGFDPVLINYLDANLCLKNVGNNQNLMEYHMHYLTMVTSFLGLPNKPQIQGSIINKEQSLLNIIKNISGWKSGSEFNIVRAPFALMWNLTFFIPKMIINIIKIVTEFLPNFFVTIIDLLLQKRNTAANKKLNLIGYTLLGLYVGSNILLFVGRAVTSPITNLRFSWKMSEDFAQKFKLPAAAKAVGILLIAMSIVISLAVYTLAFPLAVKALGMVVLGKLPAVIGQVFSMLPSFLPPAIPSMVSAAIQGLVTVVVMGVLSNFRKIPSSVNFYFNNPINKNVGVDKARNSPILYNDALKREVKRPLSQLTVGSSDLRDTPKNLISLEKAIKTGSLPSTSNDTCSSIEHVYPTTISSSQPSAYNSYSKASISLFYFSMFGMGERTSDTKSKLQQDQASPIDHLLINN